MKLYSQWANQAWCEQAEACDPDQLTPDYAAGFHDGFVDFVYGGGSGEPPPVPPRRFWNANLRTSDGKDRAKQWFAGYRHGARIAREGGYRETAVVDSSLADGLAFDHRVPARRSLSEIGGYEVHTPAGDSAHLLEELPPILDSMPAPQQRTNTPPSASPSLAPPANPPAPDVPKRIPNWNQPPPEPAAIDIELPDAAEPVETPPPAENVDERPQRTSAPNEPPRQPAEVQAVWYESSSHDAATGSVVSFISAPSKPHRATLEPTNVAVSVSQPNRSNTRDTQPAIGTIDEPSSDEAPELVAPPVADTEQDQVDDDPRPSPNDPVDNAALFQN